MLPLNNLATGPSRRHASLQQASLLAADSALAYFIIRLSALSGPLSTKPVLSLSLLSLSLYRVSVVFPCTFTAVVIDGSCLLAS